MNIMPFLAAFLALVLTWELAKFMVRLRKQETNLAGVHIERGTAPKRYWALTVLHATLIVLVAVVLLNLVGVLTL
jgi:hypothetical protein